MHLEDGRIGHAEVRIGDAVIMMFDRTPEWPMAPSRAYWSRLQPFMD